MDVLNLITMYEGIVNSPPTTITGTITPDTTTINVLDDTHIPEPPNLLVLGGSSASAETVRIISKVGTQLLVARGEQGTAKSWPVGTLIARNFTEYDYEALRQNILLISEILNKTLNSDAVLGVGYLGHMFLS